MKLVQYYADKTWHQFNKNLAGTNAATVLSQKIVALLEKGKVGDAQMEPQAFANEPIGFSFSRTSLLASALNVVYKMKPQPAGLVDKLRSQIIKDMRDGLVWAPLDVAQVIKDVTPIMLAELKDSASPEGSVSFSDGSGKPLDGVTAIKGGYSVSLKASDLAGRDVSKITLGGLSGRYSVFGRLAASIAYKDLAPISQGITVSRTLMKIGPNGAAPLDSGVALGVGDVVVSKIEVRRTDADNRWYGQSPSDWFVVQDSVPSSAELIDDDRTYLADAKLVQPGDTYWTAIKETLRYPDRIERVVRLSSGETFTAYSVWRVGYQGEAQIGPARAFNMYVKGFEGNTGAGVISSRSR
jgi:hypothetical protein